MREANVYNNGRQTWWAGAPETINIPVYFTEWGGVGVFPGNGKQVWEHKPRVKDYCQVRYWNGD